MTPSNCRSSRLTLTVKDNFDFALPEPVYVYTDFIKPNLVGDSYVRLLTSLHFASATGYHRFRYQFYKSVEQSFIESIAIRLVTKTIGMTVIYRIQTWKLCYIARHHLLLQSIASDLRKYNLLVVLSTVQLLISLG